MPIVRKFWSLRLLETSGTVRRVQGLILKGGKNWFLSVFVRSKTRNRTLCHGIMSRHGSILLSCHTSFLGIIFCYGRSAVRSCSFICTLVQICPLGRSHVAFFVLHLVKYRLGVQIQARGNIFCSPNRPDRLWGPPSLKFSVYRG
jgi:hypothetical protein